MEFLFLVSTKWLQDQYFNEMLSNQFYITKSSRDIGKIRAEHDFYYLLPEKIQTFFVKPFDFEIKESIARYTMERLNIPDFAIQWIHKAVSEEQFSQFLDIAFYFIDQRPKKVVSEKDYSRIHQSTYIHKVYNRIETLKKLSCYDRLNDYISHGTCYTSIHAIYEKYISMLNAITNNTHFLMMSHGDFCFSNILYDSKRSSNPVVFSQSFF